VARIRQSASQFLEPLPSFSRPPRAPAARRVWRSGFGVYGSWFMLQGLRVQGVGSRV